MNRIYIWVAVGVLAALGAWVIFRIQTNPDIVAGNPTATSTSTGGKKPATKPVPISVPVGYISGQVTLAPLCPVQRPEAPCRMPPDTYTSRNVVVYLSDATTVKIKKALTEGGTYALTLAPGVYYLQIVPAGIGPGEKKKVTIVSSKTSTVDFDIDTGIR